MELLWIGKGRMSGQSGEQVVKQGIWGRTA
jgi:hypothetical protein